MKTLKKLVTLSVLTATLGTSLPLLDAAEGSGYEDANSASRISPSVVVGATAIAIGIAVLVHNRRRHHHSGGGGGTGGNTHGHGHSHG